MGASGAADRAGQAGRASGQANMRDALNAIFYLLRTGCRWRYLPRDGFPPRSTVYNIFRDFQRDGVWHAIWQRLHMDLREDVEGEASPTAAVLGSQSLKSAEKGRSCLAGYDAGKKVKGRKIHALVDTQGLRFARRHSFGRCARPRWSRPRARQNPQQLSLARTHMGGQRIQRPSSQSGARQGSVASHRNHQTQRRHKRLRCFAASLSHRANLLIPDISQVWVHRGPEFSESCFARTT